MEAQRSGFHGEEKAPLRRLSAAVRGICVPGDGAGIIGTREAGTGFARTSVLPQAKPRRKGEFISPAQVKSKGSPWKPSEAGSMGRKKPHCDGLVRQCVEYVCRETGLE